MLKILSKIQCFSHTVNALSLLTVLLVLLHDVKNWFAINLVMDSKHWKCSTSVFFKFNLNLQS